MKYRLIFQCNQPLVLPRQYNSILQAAILSWLNDKKYSTFLHDKGYESNKRKFKMYTFSKIYGAYTYDDRNKKLIFEDEFQIYLSFYTDEAHKLILSNFEEQRPIIFGNIEYRLVSCEMAVEDYQNCIVDTLSPITIHSTFELPNGKKKTYYYSPSEKDFSDMIRDNLIRKYVAIYGEEPEDRSFRIKPLKCKERVMYYNRFIIKAWDGRFQLEGSPQLIKMALLSGMGARNGIGFGCLGQQEVINQ